MTAPAPTNNQNSLDGLQEIVWDIFAKRDFEILELPEYQGSIGKRVLGVFEIDQKYTDLLLAAINKTIMEARLDELLKTVITIEGFMNGTSSHPAADGLLEIKDRIAELQQLIKKYGRADNEKV